MVSLWVLLYEYMEKWSQGFASFMQGVRHDACIERESPRNHATRLVSEMHQDLDGNIQSHEEGVAIIAKLDIVFEILASVKDAELLREAKEIQTDIDKRYPGLIA